MTETSDTSTAACLDTVDFDDDAVLTVSETSRMTGLHATVLAKMRQTGGGPRFLKLGHRTIGYRRGSVRAWLREREFASTLDAKAYEEARGGAKGT